MDSAIMESSEVGSEFKSLVGHTHSPLATGCFLIRVALSAET